MVDEFFRSFCYYWEETFSFQICLQTRCLPWQRKRETKEKTKREGNKIKTKKEGKKNHQIWRKVVLAWLSTPTHQNKSKVQKNISFVVKFLKIKVPMAFFLISVPTCHLEIILIKRNFRLIEVVIGIWLRWFCWSSNKLVSISINLELPKYNLPILLIKQIFISTLTGL